MVLAVMLTSALTCCAFYPKRVGPVGPAGQQLTWSEMNFSQRQEHMRNKVLPITSDIFGSWRPDRHAAVDCSLCHALGKTHGIYDMPTANLPRLSGELFLGPEFARAPETTRLKLNRLVPEMSAALGLKPFSIVTQRGFGCYSCHLGPGGAMYGN